MNSPNYEAPPPPKYEALQKSRPKKSRGGFTFRGIYELPGPGQNYLPPTRVFSMCVMAGVIPAILHKGSLSRLLVEKCTAAFPTLPCKPLCHLSTPLALDCQRFFAQHSPGPVTRLLLKGSRYPQGWTAACPNFQGFRNKINQQKNILKKPSFRRGALCWKIFFQSPPGGFLLVAGKMPSSLVLK